MAVCLRHVHHSFEIDSDTNRSLKSSNLRSVSTPLCEERSRARELLDAMIAVRHIDVAAGVHGDAGRIEKLAVAPTSRAPHGDERPRARELLDSGVVRLRDVDAA